MSPVPSKEVPRPSFRLNLEGLCWAKALLDKASMKRIRNCFFMVSMFID
jgi:hypothetical protein